MEVPYTNRSAKLINSAHSAILSKSILSSKKTTNDRDNWTRQKPSYFEKLKQMIGRRSYLDTVTEQHQKSRSRSQLGNRGVSVGKRGIIPRGLSRPKNKNILVPNNSITEMRIPVQKKEKKEIVNYQSKFEVIIESGFKNLQMKQIIGTGANAVVKKASSLNMQLAVKIYQKYKLIQPSKLKTVFKQIKLMKKLSHPDIIQLYGAHQSSKQIHVIMQYFQGKTLYQHMRQNQFSIPLNLSLHILSKLSSVLYYIHQDMQIAHRDLKLQNILISPDLSQIRVIDFGYSTSTLLPCQQSCGTPNYMAPQLFNKNTVYECEKVDMWAFGVIMYHLIEGVFPFRGYDEKDLVRRIKQRDIRFKRMPAGMQYIILGLLEIDVGLRIGARELRGIQWEEFKV